MRFSHTLFMVYGAKLAGRYFWVHQKDCMRYLGFESIKADRNGWFRVATRGIVSIQCKTPEWSQKMHAL